MPDYRQDLQFGVFITPVAAQADAVLELARAADTVGLDLVSFQDHPYQPSFLETWTLLSVVAAQTTHVRVAPNVANLPLRQPAVLARAAASLDILSGGRVDLGLGAGAFWDGIAAMGGPRWTPGQSVDALSEAVDVIRAIWGADGGSARYHGNYYTLDGAKTGPPPVHEIEIWLGAYKPRMLRLTGRKANGWLPSLGYLELDQLPDMNARIDEAAVKAGRRPEDVRRMFNVNGEFGGGAGFLQGSPSEWAEQLAELTLSTGMSTYILAVSSADDMRRFAEEVAPAVRERVADARGREPQESPAGAAVVEQPPPTSAPPAGAGQHLIDVHNALRAELDQLRDLVEQVAAGTSDAAAVRSFINRMTIRQNNWTLGTFCETYCRTVTNHHMLEDRSIFPHLRRSEPELGAVIERLEEEHHQIADLLERVDRALVALVSSEQDGIDRVGRAMEELTEALLAHFTYEERELVGPLDRHGFY
jgi:alkanesulfonate monooxygenase SsuD/methylene tetrahydromethanopterin reductase-like flavin-dependent oxidoreductase (luciferase family)/iron-sulfur cluster repair protein YtfE (RIC family)